MSPVDCISCQCHCSLEAFVQYQIGPADRSRATIIVAVDSIPAVPSRVNFLLAMDSIPSFPPFVSFFSLSCASSRGGIVSHHRKC